MLTITKKKTLKLSDRQEQEIKDEILEWYGIRLNTNQINKLLKAAPFEGAIWTIGKSWDFDTAAREELVNLICQDVMNRDWPTCGEISKMSGKREKRLWSAMKTALLAKGYVLDEKDEDWVNNKTY